MIPDYKDPARYTARRRGGGSETNAKSEYPPEFRPLAESAVKQIQAMQGANPYAMYAAPNPAATAGLSPWQSATLDTLPRMTETNQAMIQAGRLPDAMVFPTVGAMQTADVTGAAQRSLRSLDKYGGGGAGNEFHPMDQSRGGRSGMGYNDNRPQSFRQEHVIGAGAQGFAPLPSSPDAQSVDPRFAGPGNQMASVGGGPAQWAGNPSFQQSLLGPSADPWQALLAAMSGAPGPGGQPPAGSEVAPSPYGASVNGA